MDNSVYVTLSKQIALFRDMDVTAGNIANANTTGFNGEHVVFSSYLGQDVNNGQKNDMSFAYDTSTTRDMSQGAIKSTNNPLDVAIEGQGYFAVQTPLGTRYTRAGNFTLNGTGQLISADGYPVLDATNQPLEFPENTTSIDIGSLGNVKVNGEDFGTIGVFKFTNPQLLERAGNNLYKASADPQVAEEDVTVVQGALESSNVQPVAELTHMISVSRSVDNSMQFVGAIYDLERKASNAWAQQQS